MKTRIGVDMKWRASLVLTLVAALLYGPEYKPFKDAASKRGGEGRGDG